MRTQRSIEDQHVPAQRLTAVVVPSRASVWRRRLDRLTAVVVPSRASVLHRGLDRPALRHAAEASIAVAPVAVVVVALAAAVASQVALLDRSVWFDELYTINTYILPGLTAPFHGYVPNDHILFELLAWLTVNITNNRGDAAFRLWSVLPALAALAVVVHWTWHRLGRWETALLAVLVASSPLYLFLGPEARGYGLGFLSVAVMVTQADRLRWQGTRRSLLLLAGGAVVGIFTLPIIVLPFLGIALVLAAADPRLRRRIGYTVVAVGVATLIFYAPVLGGLIKNSSQQFGVRLPWDGLVQGPVSSVLDPSLTLWLPHLGGLRAASASREWLAGLTLVAGAIVLWRRPERVLTLLLVVPAVMTYAVFEILRFYVSVRFGSFLLMPLMLLAAVALAAPVRAAAGRTALELIATGVAVTFSAFAMVRFERFFVAFREVPIENSRDAAAIVQASGMSRVFTNSDRAGGFEYYLRDHPVLTRQSPVQLATTFCRRPPPFAYIEDSQGSLPDVACLLYRDPVTVPVPELRRRVRVVFVTSPAPAPARSSALRPVVASDIPFYPATQPYRLLIERLLH